MTEPNDNQDAKTKPALVVMAAGLGSRFGGVKQLAKVGPKGEAFLDFSINDALDAGFGEVVMIVRSDIEADVKAHIDSQHKSLAVSYVCQDKLGPERDKPWGTVHAILSAAEAINTPFAVVNADDYYGPKSFLLAADLMGSLKPGIAANVAFELGHTVPPRGSVTRAVTKIADGHLAAIVETEQCQLNDDGTYSAGGKEISASTPVSMNLWCFHETIMSELQSNWEKFLAGNGNDPKAEVQLPTAIGEFINAGKLVVEVSSSPEKWIGITNPEDFETAKAVLSDR